MATRQRWVDLRAVATHLGYSPITVRRWIRRGLLRASRVQDAHYADERQRKTHRGQWRVYEDDLRQFLSVLRSGRTVTLPDGFWRGWTRGGKL